MAAPTVAGRIIRRLRAERSLALRRTAVPRFPRSLGPAALGPADPMRAAAGARLRIPEPAPDPDSTPSTAPRARRFHSWRNALMTDRHASTATLGQAKQEAREWCCRTAREVLAAMVTRAASMLASALFLAMGGLDHPAQAQLTDETAVLTISAGSDTYGYQIDDVVFTVTRTGPAEAEIGGSVTMTQDDTYLPAESLSWTFTIPANAATVTLPLLRAAFTGGATQTGRSHRDARRWRRLRGGHAGRGDGGDGRGGPGDHGPAREGGLQLRRRRRCGERDLHRPHRDRRGPGPAGGSASRSGRNPDRTGPDRRTTTRLFRK